MTLPLTPTNLRAAYDFLASTAPFKDWNLPDGEDITFKVLRRRDTDAQIDTNKNKVTIAVSAGRNGHTATVLLSLAHEMIHLHETRCKIRWRGVEHHGRAFRKWAAEVCEVHGFDPKLFY